MKATLLLVVACGMLLGPSAAGDKTSDRTTPVPPIIIVPGLGGSVLRASLHNRPAYRDCATNSKDYTIFFSEVQALARFACWEENLSLLPSEGDASEVRNFTGVSISPYDYGGVKGIEFSNAGTSGEVPLPYMKDLIKALEKVGYERGTSLRAATYDFRAAGTASQLAWQFSRLAALIEQTYELNGKQKVHLVSHSLGGPYATVFLSRRSQSWKDSYVASHFLISPPLLGTPVAIEALVSGPEYDYVPQFLPSLVVPLLRSWPSMLWMWPSSYSYADVWKDTVFIETPTRNYTVKELRSLLDEINATSLSDLMPSVDSETGSSGSAPGVPCFCAFANDTKTDLTLRLASDPSADNGYNPNGKVTSQTWGDGTVSLSSLRHCGSWSETKYVREYEYGGSLAAHTEIVRFKPLQEDLISWVFNGTHAREDNDGIALAMMHS